MFASDYTSLNTTWAGPRLDFGMAAIADLFWSFRSPYSYLAQAGRWGVPTFVFEGEPFRWRRHGMQCST
jgi:2-hydroxychromene-2-carboxylate isomerase